MILSSKDLFIPKYKDGSKKHSMREDIHGRWKPGTSIQFFARTRTKDMHKFLPDNTVKSIQSIKVVFNRNAEFLTVIVDDKPLSTYDQYKLIKNDGFEKVEDFISFFFKDADQTKYCEWKGVLIHWTDLKY